MSKADYIRQFELDTGLKVDRRALRGRRKSPFNVNGICICGCIFMAMYLSSLIIFAISYHNDTHTCYQCDFKYSTAIITNSFYNDETNEYNMNIIYSSNNSNWNYNTSFSTKYQNLYTYYNNSFSLIQTISFNEQYNDISSLAFPMYKNKSVLNLSNGSGFDLILLIASVIATVYELLFCLLFSLHGDFINESDEQFVHILIRVSNWIITFALALIPFLIIVIIMNSQSNSISINELHWNDIYEKKMCYIDDIIETNEFTFNYRNGSVMDYYFITKYQIFFDRNFNSKGLIGIGVEWMDNGTDLNITDEELCYQNRYTKQIVVHELPPSID